MSRCSLRLDDSRLDRSSASFSVGGASWGSSRLSKSRRSQRLSLSCSESLLNTPHKLSAKPFINSSIHSEASDASLLSSLLDDSSVKEHTLVDSLWGLDHDVDPKGQFTSAEASESTIIPEHSTVLADHTLIGPEDCCVRHPVQTLSRIPCRDCESRPERKDSMHCPSSSCETALEPKEPETSIIYCRERTRKTRAGRSAVDASRWLSRQWHHMTSSHQLTWSPLGLLLLLLLLPLLLVFFSLCWPTIYGYMLPSPPAGGAVEEQRQLQLYEEPLSQPQQEAQSRPSGAEAAQEVTTSDKPMQLLHLEQSLMALWERVEAGGRREEQRHREVLQLYTELQEQQVEQIRSHLEQERQQREQGRLQRHSQTSRVDQLEQQLQMLAAQTEELQRRHETPPPPAISLPAAVRESSSAPELPHQGNSAFKYVFPVTSSGGVDRQSYDTLLAEVARLEEALEDLRQDVEGLSVCRDRCGRLDMINEMISEQVSTQVRDEVRALLYGNQLAVRDGASPEVTTPPESLLEWLSQRYMSSSDLQAALSSLELSILQNISLQMNQRRGEGSDREDVLHAASVTQEDVHVIVENALRQFSQDRTGLADYALESGGGSIISTRCSETFETKAALLSLFGVPLWYFSQSPRAVIQPDVHPGNCWAFRGSKGFLVIRLSMRIVPTAVSLEHIPKALAPSGTLLSAPRDFSVYGLEDPSEENGQLLGSFTYEEDGEALQTFTVTEGPGQSFQIVELQVLSNWGHPDYTCMYRVRVHGMPVAL